MTDRNGKYQPTGAALTARQVELLIVLMEEASEVVQACAKVLRFGNGDINPRTGVENTTELSAEIGEFSTVRNMLEETGLLQRDIMLTAMKDKRVRLEKYLQT